MSVTTAIGCNWSASSNNPTWITISSNSNGIGNGTVGYTVSANTAISSRTGTMTLAGETFTVTQTGTLCTYSITPTSQSFNPTGGTGNVKVSAPSGCGWVASSSVSWINIISGSSGSGDGTVNYSVSANTSISKRTATMAIAGNNFTVTQVGAVGQIPTSCPKSISPVGNFFDKDGGTGIVDVTVPDDCNWTAVSNVPSWITVISPGANIGSVTGDGKVVYSVSANTSVSIRTGNVIIEGGDSIKTFMVAQEAACSQSISPAGKSFDKGGGAGIVNVTAPDNCNWTTKSDASWLNIVSGIGGSSNGTVNYTVSANAGTNARVGTITIEDETFTVSQLGINPPSVFSLSSASESFGSSGGMGSVSVSIPGDSGGTGSLSASISDNSGWTAASDASWLNITSSRIGTGNGTVNIFITPNTSTSPRAGTIKFADWENCACKIFTVTQEKLVPCAPTITPASDNFNAIGGSGSVSVSDPCKNGWVVVSNASWINVTSGSSESGDGTVKYTVSINDSFLSSRTGSITVAGQMFTVVQEVMNDLPDPTIRAKDSVGAMALKSDDTVSISVSLTDGGLEGTNADWWLVVSTPFGWYYYDLNLGWTPGFSVTHQGPLFDLSPFEVLNLSGLPEGTYTYYFGVDTIMNGLLDDGPESLRYDSFTVEINNTSCASSVSIPSESFDFTGGTGSLSVSDPCNKGWMVTSNSLWIHITSGNTGIGNGTVQYIVNYNHTRLSSRASGIIISDQMFKVEQGMNTIIAE